MYKPKETVMLNGKEYTISECVFTKTAKCMFCQQLNTKPPCIDRFDYPEGNITFDLHTCKENIPKNCIPKKVFSKSS